VVAASEAEREIADALAVGESWRRGYRDESRRKRHLERALRLAEALAVRHGFGKLPWCDGCREGFECGDAECLAWLEAEALAATKPPTEGETATTTEVAR
jgi:hypothetical protein